MDSTNDTTSRRSLLKKLGVGAGIAWTAPVISTLNTPAFAATTSGNNAFQFGRSGSWGPQAVSANACAPAGYSTANPATTDSDAAGMTVGGVPGNPVFTAPAGCTIIAGSGLSTGCTAGIVGGGGTTISFSGQGSGAVVRILVSCP